MGNCSRNPAIQRMRDEFISCPGCGRNRDQIYSQRPNPLMHMNQCVNIEHMIPRSRGGSNNPDNLLIICHRCNFTRGNQEPWDWYGEQHLIYQDGWPVPQQFYGRQGRRNRWLWENRGRSISALFGYGPVEFDEGFHEHLITHNQESESVDS